MSGNAVGDGDGAGAGAPPPGAVSPIISLLVTQIDDALGLADGALDGARLDERDARAQADELLDAAGDLGHGCGQADRFPVLFLQVPLDDGRIGQVIGFPVEKGMRKGLYEGL